MELRRADSSELDAVRSFYHRMIDEMEDAPYKPGWEKGVYPTDAFLAESLEKGELYVLPREGGYAAAMVMNHQCTDGYERVRWAVDAPPEQVAVIHALGVTPACQGRGVARQVVDDAIRLAAGAGQRAIRLDVLGPNLPAQKLYTKAGFQYRDTLKLFYEDTGLTDFLLYEYVL